MFPKLLMPLTGTDAQLELRPLPLNMSFASLFSSCNHIIFDDEPLMRKDKNQILYTVYCTLTFKKTQNIKTNINVQFGMILRS